jgi:hypothetical protein
MLLMWALRIYSPSVGLSRAVAKGMLEGIEGKQNNLPMSGMPTLREALRGRWS